MAAAVFDVSSDANANDCSDAGDGDAAVISVLSYVKELFGMNWQYLYRSLEMWGLTHIYTTDEEQ
eukprot:scaffold69320_cov62-Attheya_sp.AAC.1